MDDGVKLAGLIDLFCELNGLADAGEVGVQYGLGFGNGFHCLSGAGGVTRVQDDGVALLNEQPGGHLTETAGGAGDENACHGGIFIKITISGWAGEKSPGVQPHARVCT